MPAPVSRRAFIGGLSAAGGLALVGTQPAGAAEVPSGFPASISLYRELYSNWDGVITADKLLTAAPRNSGDVLAVVRWARTAGWTVRARGYRHSWSPLTVAAGTAASAKVIVLDTTKHLTAMSTPAANRVTVQAGARMDTLLAHLGRSGYALAAAPAPGDVTVGGVLAVSAHGTAVPAAGELPVKGQTFGTMSNLVTSLTAIVWDQAQGTYVERVFPRTHPDCAALLTHVGRAFVTEVTLQVMADHKLRCRCWTDIPAKELFAAPGRTTSRSLSSLLDRSGRVGVIWYTYTDRPWVQEWSVTPNRPLLSRPTIGPYNFPFADNLPDAVSSLVARIVNGSGQLAPQFGQTVQSVTSLGLTATGARDMWGPARHFINFVKPTTLKVSAGSHAVVTSRASVQRVVHEFSEFFTTRLAAYQARGSFPVNSCVEIRVTGLDRPDEVDLAGAVAPALSAARPVEGHPEWDTVVWLDALTIPGQSEEYAFFAELEHFLRTNYTSYAAVRPEWAKRWATTEVGPWTDKAAMREIAQSFPDWGATMATLDRLDPHRVFTNPLLETLTRA